MTYATQQMRNMIAFIRLNIRNFDDGVGDEAHAYLTKALAMFEDAVNQLDAVPVEAIAFCVDAASYTYDVMVGEAKAWLETQVTP